MSFEIEAEGADTYEVFRGFENPQENGTTESRALQLLARLPKPAIVKDEEGRTLLHLACVNGWYDVAKVLIHTYFCIPTLNSVRYGTPLHQACAGGNLDIVRHLVHDHNCDPKCKSGDGTTPLHYASSCGKIDVAKFLINGQGCDVNCRRNGGATPLHEACAGGHLEMTEYFLNLLCDPKCIDNAGTTPLHYACSYGHINIAKCLIQVWHCPPNCRKDDGSTPLHEACAGGHLDIVQYLVTEQNCDPDTEDSAGWTPLHYACYNHGHMTVVQYLIGEYNCDPKCRSNNDGTPLHIACAGGNIDIVRCLVLEHRCSPTRARNGGITPLHEACSGGHLNIVKFLILEKHCDPECTDDSGATPLHYACSKGHVDVAEYLVQEQRCFIQPKSNNGVTPLQRACTGGHLDIVKFLVSDCSCNIKDNLWYLPSPVQIAYDNNHIDIVAFFLAKQDQTSTGFLSRFFRRKVPIKKLEDELLHHPFFKLFVVGEAEVGKSTLIKALEHKLSEVNRFDLAGRFRTVTGVEPHTAGIIPVYIERPSGNIILYDLAGQPEYYSSHAALLQSLVSSPETLVLIVVKLTESVESMVCTLQYWSSIITSLCQQGQEQKKLPSVMVVGSYADSVQSRVYAEQNLSNACKQVKNDIIEQAHRIILNCTRLRTSGLNFISDSIAQQCSRFQQEVQVDMQVNFVNLMINKYLNKNVACRFSRIAEVNGASMNAKLRESGLLPSDNATLCEHLTTLSDHGRLLFLRSKEDIDNSWVILKVDVLLSEVNGTIFAPEYFKQHHDISNNTGVVPYSKIRDIFFKHNPQMIMDFLIHFEFCHKISESEVLQISRTTPRMSESSELCYYLFPALVTVDRPEDSCRSIIEQTHYKSGWCLECEGNDIFPSQFLHILLIRLAFSFALPSDSNRDNPVIQRECNVWTTGIHWQNMDGVEAIVEVVDQSKAVVLMLGCLEGREIACVKLRSDIIRTILQVKSRFSGAVEAREYVIHPVSLPLPSTKQLSKFSIVNLARAVREDKKIITSKEGQNLQMVEISTALHFEPYACLSHKLIIKLRDETVSDQEVSDAYLSDIACDLHPQMAFLQEILEYDVREFAAKCNSEQSPIDSIRQCFLLLRSWKYGRSEENATYKELQIILDHCSVFCGRNPVLLVSQFMDTLITVYSSKCHAQLLVMFCVIIAMCVHLAGAVTHPLVHNLLQSLRYALCM